MATAGNCVKTNMAESFRDRRWGGEVYYYMAAEESTDDPLDCRPNGCNAECEGRHLDELEVKRFQPEAGFSYPSQPNLIVTASRDMGRSASTWVFNAVRLLHRQARVACDSYWIRTLSKEKLQQRLQSGASVVVKTHEWTGEVRPAEFREMLPMFTHVVVSVRQGFPEDPAWTAVASHVVHFEDVVRPPAHGGAAAAVAAGDEEEEEEATAAGGGSAGEPGALGVLRALAEHLGLGARLAPGDYRAVDHALMTLPVPRAGGGDPVTKLWPFHARRGGRLPPPPPPPPSSGPGRGGVGEEGNEEASG